jgi:hypothetical protein
MSFRRYIHSNDYRWTTIVLLERSTQNSDYENTV